MSGEAWALTHDSGWFGKRFPSIRVGHDAFARLRGPAASKELISRVLKSFMGAAEEDQFIRARLDGIHRRYLMSKSDVEHVRGFDAITQLLLEAGVVGQLAELDDDAASEELAELLGHDAKADDRFVHNVLLRIRAKLR